MTPPHPLHLICSSAQPFSMWISLKSCLTISSMCVSEPVSMLSKPLPYWTDSNSCWLSWRAAKRREMKSKPQKNVVSYLQSSGVYPISGQAGRWAREAHDKRSRYAAGAWMRDREGGRKGGLGSFVRREGGNKYESGPRWGSKNITEMRTS